MVSRERLLRLRSVVLFIRERQGERERENFQNSPTSIRNKQEQTIVVTYQF